VRRAFTKGSRPAWGSVELVVNTLQETTLVKRAGYTILYPTVALLCLCKRLLTIPLHIPNLSWLC